MKETMLQKVMWTAFSGTFAKALESELAVEKPKEAMKTAQKSQTTINQYTATFTTCGILHLMTKWNCAEYVPAMCTFDYDMDAMNHTEFTRQYTLASGGSCCDCHYNHKI